MAKADWSCDECGEVLPADHFVQVTDREVARTSGSTRIYKGTRGGLGVGGSSSTSYRHVKKKLCPECVAYRIELARRARARRRIQWLIVGGAGAVLLIIFLASLPPSARAPAPIPIVAADNGQVGTIAEAAPDSAPSKETNTFADAAPAAVETPSEEQTNATLPVVVPSDPAAPPLRFAGNSDAEMADAIQQATPGALEDGETVTWQGGDRHGYIVVSEPQQRGSKVCRNARWTMITANNQIQGPSAQWCTTDGGSWVKQRE